MARCVPGMASSSQLPFLPPHLTLRPQSAWKDMLGDCSLYTLHRQMLLIMNIIIIEGQFCLASTY